MSKPELLVSEIANSRSKFEVIRYGNRTIKNKVYFNITVHSSLDVYFDDCEFEEDVLVEISIGHARVTVNFNKCHFRKNFCVSVSQYSTCKLEAQGASFYQGLVINTKHPISVDLKDAKWSKNILLEDCEFSFVNFENLKCIDNSSSNKFNAAKSKFNINNFKSAFLGEADFRKAEFNEKTIFDSCSFESGFFNQCLFKSTLIFTNITVQKSLFLSQSRFMQGVFAQGIRMSERSETIIEMSECDFEANSYFDNSISRQVMCQNSRFKGLVSFNGSVFFSVDFINTQFLNGADFSHTKYSNANLETLRKIKSELIRGENHVDLLFYKAKELMNYTSQLSYRKNFFEKFMLKLNQVSTKHGLHWGRGVLFTFVISIFFYTLYLITLKNNGLEWEFVSWDKYWEAVDVVVIHYFKFLAIFRDFDFIEGSEPKSWNYFFDFMGRIFIGYGIYQTVQAFRKYGKT